MVQLKFPLKFVFFAVVISKAFGLKPSEEFSEGSCYDSPTHGISANRAFVDSLKYISGGSKYFFHRLASSLPNYDNLTEPQLYSEACLTRNITTTISSSIATISGFEITILRNTRVLPRTGIYFEGIPTGRGESSWNTETHVVTLTDHKTFAVIRTCFDGINVKSWEVVTSTPEKLKDEVKKEIEEHVKGMGFKQENIAYLDFDKCGNEINEQTFV